jgi:hypothetical protein
MNYYIIECNIILLSRLQKHYYCPDFVCMLLRKATFFQVSEKDCGKLPSGIFFLIVLSAEEDNRAVHGEALF